MAQGIDADGPLGIPFLLMHLENRSSSSQLVCYPDRIATLLASAFGDHPTLGICWGEPSDSNLVLDVLCDRAQDDLTGAGVKGMKNANPRIQIVHLVYELPLVHALSADDAVRFMRSCIEHPFKHNLCGVHSDLYQDIVDGLLERRRGTPPAIGEDESGVTLYFPMDVGDQPRLILFDMHSCPDWRAVVK